MAKKALFFIAILLFFSFTYATRPGPTLSGDSAQKIQQEVPFDEEMNVGDLCAGVGEDECLIRRTLAAHVDYIYTQKHKNP